MKKTPHEKQFPSGEFLSVSLENMRMNLIAAICIAGLLMGCEACPHYNRTRIASPTGGPVVTTARKPYGSVKLYQDKSAVPGPYDVIAILSVSGDAGDEARFITAFLYRAADAGADGLIFTRLAQQAVASPGPFFTTINSVSAAYQGEAIRFR